MSNIHKKRKNSIEEKKNDVSEEDHWELAANILKLESQMKRRGMLTQIGTFEDPEQTRREKAEKEYKDYHEFVSFINKMAVFIELSELSQNETSGKTQNKNPGQMISNLMKWSHINSEQQTNLFLG